MSELSVVAVLVARSGQEDLVRSALLDLVLPPGAEEGCLAYESFESGAAPGTFLTRERWRGQEDLDARLQTAHVQRALAAAGDALASPPGINRSPQ